MFVVYYGVIFDKKPYNENLCGISIYPDDGDGVLLRNFGVYNSSETAVCPRKGYLVPFTAHNL